MIDWWEIGQRWRAKHAALAHGDMVRETAKSADEYKIAPNTLRGFKSAVEFCEKLRADGQVDDAGKLALAGKPLKIISVLQRVSRCGTDELRPLLNAVLGPEPPDRHGLAELEAAARARSRPAADPGANAHAYRLLARSFRARALDAVRKDGLARDEVTVSAKSSDRFEPFQVDAVTSLGGAAYRGLRLIGVSAGTSVRPRLAEALLPALAAARAFEAFILLTESTDDASDLVQRINRIGKCGVGVWSYDPVTGIEVRREPLRSRRPDLAARYAEAQAACFAEPDAGDATG